MQIKNNYDITWEKENNQKQEYNIGGYKIPQKPEIGTGVFNGEMGTILEIDEKERKIILNLTIDTNICPVLDYFEIFMQRTMMSKYAAKYLKVWFELVINGTKLL